MPPEAPDPQTAAEILRERLALVAIEMNEFDPFRADLVEELDSDD